jgi:hypothetical protein
MPFERWDAHAVRLSPSAVERVMAVFGQLLDRLFRDCPALKGYRSEYYVARGPGVTLACLDLVDPDTHTPVWSARYELQAGEFDIVH